MTWNDALGNVSYLLIAVSYLVTHMLWLRVLAMLGLVAEAVYFYAAGSGSLWVAIGWSVVFLLINGVQLLRLLRELRAAQLQGDERLLKSGPFASLSLPSFRRLMKAGRWQTLAPGTLLTVQHAPVTHLRALTHGRALVDVDGKPIATVHPGGIVGEMSLFTGDAASATVCVTDEARCFEVDGATLRQLLAEHDDLRAQFHHALGTELTGKLLALRSPALARRA